MSKTISILGTGWLGLPLAKHLKILDYNIKGSTTSTQKINDLMMMGVSPYLIQVDDRVVGLKGEDFFDADVLIITVPPSRDVEYNKKRFQNIADLIKKGNVRKLIYTSSTGVYGNATGIVTEDMTPEPARVSAQGVYFAEQTFQALDIDLTICRLAGLVGGKRKAGRFFAGRLNAPQGNSPVNLVHQEDCVNVITKIIEQDCWNEIFNVCADIHPPRKVFYPYQAQLQNLAIPTFAPDDKSPSEYKIVSNAKVKEALNYTFKHPDPMMF